MQYNGNGSVYGSAPGNNFGGYHKSARILYYKIGDEKEKVFNRSEEKDYKNYISSNEKALKNFKIYKGCKIGKLAGIGIFVGGMFTILSSVPVGVIVMGTGLVVWGSGHLLSGYFIKKSAKVFNHGLKGSKKQKKLK